MNDDLGFELEEWFRFLLPWQLRLSGSKCVAVEKVFSRFADYVRPLAHKSPREFKIFLDELRTRSERVSKWKAPHGTRCVMQGAEKKYPNGHPRYTLMKVQEVLISRIK